MKSKSFSKEALLAPAGTPGPGVRLCLVLSDRGVEFVHGARAVAEYDEDFSGQPHLLTYPETVPIFTAQHSVDHCAYEVQSIP